MTEKKYKQDNKALKEATRIELSNKVIQVCSKHLTTLEWEVLTKVLLDNQTFAEIAEKRELTSGRVKQIFEKAVRRTISYLTSIDEKIIEFNKSIKEHKNIVNQLENYKNREEENNKEKRILASLTPEVKKLLQTKISESELPVRMKSVCEYGNIKTIADLVKSSPRELLKLRNCGKKSIKETEDFFRRNKLDWGMLETD